MEELPALVKRLHTHAGKVAAVAMAVERGIPIEPALLAEYNPNGHSVANVIVQEPVHSNVFSEDFAEARKIRRKRYSWAMHTFVEEGEYWEVYSDARARQLLPKLKRLFQRKIPDLEQKGMFVDCGVLEYLIGNRQRAESYWRLADMLKPKC